jgi:hypothetical protein
VDKLIEPHEGSGGMSSQWLVLLAVIIAGTVIALALLTLIDSENTSELDRCAQARSEYRRADVNVEVISSRPFSDQDTAQARSARYFAERNVLTNC